MQNTSLHNLTNDISQNSKFVTVTREMLDTIPELWYHPTRKKYVLIIHEKDIRGKKYRRRISTGTDKLSVAKVFRTEWLQMQTEQGSKVVNPFSVATALDEAFKSKRETQNLQHSTCKETERSIRYFVDFIRTETEENNYPVQLITFEHCNGFLRSITSPRQRNKHRANLSALWNTLIDYRETYGILDNPFARTKKVKPTDTEPEQITDREFRLLYEGMRTVTFQMQMYKLACAFSYYTGSRLAEVCFIRSKHTTGKDIQIRNYTDHTIKNKQRREVPATSKVREILMQVRVLKSQHKSEHVQNSEYLFCTEKGNHLVINNLSAYFRENRKVILSDRTKVTFHSLRRSYGQNLLNEGVTIANVSRLLGHSSIAVTEKHYANTRNIPLDSFREQVNTIHSQTRSLESPAALTPEATHYRTESLTLSPYGVSVGVQA